MIRTAWVVLIAVVAAVGAPADEALRDGLAALKAGRPEAAAAYFDAAIEAAPDDLAAYYWRARARAELGRWDAAVEDLVHIVRHKPSSAASWVALGEAYLELRRINEARSAIEQALALEPRNEEAAKLLKRAERAAEEASATVPVVASIVPRAADIGPRVAIQTSGLRLAAREVDVEGRQLYDYTFGTAPTDWEPASGTWAISSRYSCEPEWSFYGGHSRGICAVWNKRRFRGDIVVEAYVAFKHGLPWASNTWHYIPTDLNINLCSTRGDLSTGYSFIYSGNNGSTTMIRRGQRVLAATTDPRFIAPQFSDVNPLFQPDARGRQFGEFHRHWWRLEARRKGRRLTFLIDGQKALEVDDPAPLDTGHVAIWTVGSGMVIARLRIAYEEELGRDRPSVVVASPAPLDSTLNVARK